MCDVIHTMLAQSLAFPSCVRVPESAGADIVGVLLSLVNLQLDSQVAIGFPPTSYTVLDAVMQRAWQVRGCVVSEDSGSLGHLFHALINYLADHMYTLCASWQQHDILITMFRGINCLLVLLLTGSMSQTIIVEQMEDAIKLATQTHGPQTWQPMSEEALEVELANVVQVRNRNSQQTDTCFPLNSNCLANVPSQLGK